MYIIDKEKNRISRLDKKTFGDLGFKERENLQEWLANNPEALGEELLIIQKEFDGFNDTRERLDLLALDKQGNIVVIENKLDDSGRDVTWQVLKYASYASSLTKENIRNIYQSYLGTSGSAEEKLTDFFNTEYTDLLLNQGSSQRIMMVAGQFRKEVTSTVLWLMNYKIRIQCFKVTPYALEDKLFLDLEQILPLKDAEEYIISMAEKAQEDIASQESLKLSNNIRYEFWSQFISYNNTKNNLTQNISPAKDSWIGVALGISGVNINTVVSKNYARNEIYINRGDKVINKEIFDFLFKHKSEIEQDFGKPLIWERMDDKVTCRIKNQLDNVSVFNKEDWPQMNKFLQASLEQMAKSFKEPIRKLSNHLKNKKD
jgi:hypothetical protein